MALKWGGPAEVVRNGLDGYLIDSSRISAIAEKIQEIAHDRSEWERLSANAAKRADDFSLSVFEQRVATLMFAELSVFVIARQLVILGIRGVPARHGGFETFCGAAVSVLG